MNISIPDALRERMQPFDERANWSAIAAEAFTAAVDRMVALDAIDDPVKRRLEETDIEDTAKIVERGRKAGMEWAKRHARKIHLRRLSVANQEMDGDPWEEPDQVAKAALGDQSATWLGDMPGMNGLPDKVEVEFGWLTAFVDAAVEVYDQL